MVYFIRAVDGSLIKIGTTIRLSERLKALCREAGSDLQVLAVLDGGRDIEKSLHRRFSHLRTVGEWFEPGDDLRGFIIAEGRPWNGSDEVPNNRYSAVKVDRKVIDKLKMVALHRKITLAELLTESLRATADKMHTQMVRELEGKN